MVAKERIFLAHASEDKPQVRQLYDQLKELGLSPWLDTVDLIPGQNWREEIPRAIKNAAFCLACLSKRSIDKRSYVQREFRYALSAYADRPPGSIYLIPVRLDDCEVPDLRIAELELNLRDLHWVDLFAENGLKKLIDAIELEIEPGEKVPMSAPNQRKAFEVFKDIDAPWCPEMVRLPAGIFMMGPPNAGPQDKTSQQQVNISRPFALGRHAVTFDEYDYFCDQTGRKKPQDRSWGRGRRPVIWVSHEDAKEYCAWLSQVTQAAYQLPTDAMWEYACRAGTTTRFSFGDRVTRDQVNCATNYPLKAIHAARSSYRQMTVPVCSLPANPWGFFEMHGNVKEWCADWFNWCGYNQCGPGPVIDPQGPATGNERVVRGGSWRNEATHLSSHSRSLAPPGRRSICIGFRCARVQDVSPPPNPKPKLWNLFKAPFKIR